MTPEKRTPIAAKPTKNVTLTIDGMRRSVAPIWGLVATESIRVRRALDLFEAELESTYSVSGWRRFSYSAKESSITDIKENLASNDLFEPRRIFLVWEAEGIKASELKLLQSAIMPDGNTWCCLICSKVVSKAPLKALAGGLIELDTLGGGDLIRWTQDEWLALQNVSSKKSDPKASKSKSNLSTNLAEEVARIGNNNPDHIHQLLSQLSLYCTEGSAPSSEDLRALFSTAAHRDEFKLVDIIASGNQIEITAYVAQLSYQESNPFAIVGILFRSFSTLQELAELVARKASTPQIAKSLGKPQWLIEKQLKLLGKYRKYKFAAELRSILDAGLELRNKNLGTGEVLIKLALNLTPQPAK